MTSIIRIMAEREILKYFRNKLRVIGMLSQPVLFLLTFGFGLSPMFAKAGHGDYIQYLTPGMAAMTILYSAVMGGMSLIWDKQFGFLKETLVAPVSRTDLLIGRCLGGAVTSVFQGLIVVCISFFMGFRVPHWYFLPLAAVSMFCVALLFSLLGTIIAARVDDFHSFPVIMNFLITPMFFLSGALFPAGNFPVAIRMVTVVNPMTYCVGLLQSSFGSTGYFFLKDCFIVAGAIVALGLIGTRCFRNLEA